MSKPMIVGLTAGAAIAAGKFLKADGAGAVIENDTAGLEVGISESFADPALPAYKSGKIGCIKQGIVSVTAVAATYNEGDKLEVATGGQSVQSLASGALVATALESKVLAAPGALKVYLNVA